MSDVESELDYYFGDVDDSVPTGEGLSKRACQVLLIEERNSLIQISNLKRIRMTNGYTPLAPAFTGLRHIQRAVFMARQRGGYDVLLSNAGY
jgi:hypothetical protein